MLVTFVFLFFVGFIALHYSSNNIIDDSQKLGVYLNVAPWLIGSLVLAIGTSLPELVITIISISKGLNVIAYNNLIGSNITNTTLALPGAWLIYSILGQSFDRFSLIIMLSVQLSLVFIMHWGTLNTTTSFILISIFIVYIIKSITNNNYINVEDNTSEKPNFIKFIISFIVLPLASYCIVYSVENISEHFGISHAFLGMFVIAFGTSIPETYSTLLALKNNKANIAIGNIVGSNIVNTAVILPVIGFWSNYSLGIGRELYDLIFMCSAVLFASIPLYFRFSHKIWAILLLTLYLAFLVSWF